MCKNGHAEKKEKKAGIFCSPLDLPDLHAGKLRREDFANVLIMQPLDRHLHNPIS